MERVGAMTEKRHNWKQEAFAWKSFATMQGLALAAVAKDTLYECQCGNEPYVNGEQCPACFVLYAHAELKVKRKRFAEVAEGKSDHITKAEADEIRKGWKQ